MTILLQSLVIMIVTSFVNQDMGLQPIEVEVSLIPGIPTIQFLGLPDTAIKESVARIRSAIFHQGFELPVSQQVLINLRPNHLKKSSRGLDLAVAAAILWETGQLDFNKTTKSTNAFFNKKPITLYGELSLTGEVIAPSDIGELNFDHETTISSGLPSGCPLITGPHKQDQSLLSIDTLIIKNLRQLDSPILEKSAPQTNLAIRPKLNNLKFSFNISRLLTVIAVGEHSSLFTGPAGCGKTTMAQSVHSLLSPPSKRQLQSIQKINGKDASTKNSLLANSLNGKLNWRPLVQPHHSATMRSMIGGGYPIQYGELSRANNGLLILDELLEFKPKVLDSLREPIESKIINLARSHGVQKLPADFLLIATSNLCPCGQFIPSNNKSIDTSNNCRCRNSRREQYIEKLTGPMLDRFSILAFIDNSFSKQNEKHYVTLSDLLKNITSTEGFINNSRKQFFPNQKLTLEYFEKNEDSFLLDNLLPNTNSFRRKLSLLRVARTMADIEQSEKIKPKHIGASAELTTLPFERLHSF